MMSISAYLIFSGNCREAMTFYQECLGGALSFQTVGESPLAGQLPTWMKNCIIQATLMRGDLVLMGSDMVSEIGLTKGNSVAMMLHCSSEADTRTCYGKLSEGGMQAHPLAHTYWGALFGELTDKFGNHWLLTYHENN